MTAMMMTTTITPVRMTISCVAAGFADSPIIRHPTVGVNKTVGHADRLEMGCVELPILVDDDSTTTNAGNDGGDNCQWWQLSTMAR